MTRSNEFSGRRVVAKVPLMILAVGYRAAAIPAVTGSSSTPAIWAVGGAKPMKLPEPQPGSRT